MLLNKKTTTSLILLISATFCVTIGDATARNPDTMTEALPVYAITGHIDALNSTKCRAEMMEFRAAVDRGILWSLRMLDASGEPSSGFTSGNNYWLGDRHQCYLLSTNTSMMLSEKIARNNTIYRNPNEEFPPYDLHFFVAHIRHNSTMQYHVMVPVEDIITLGLCLPTSCTVEEVSTMLEKTFEEKSLLVGHLFSANFRLIDVSDLRDDHQWLLSAKIIVIMVILLVLCCVAIAGTLYDVLVHQKRLRKKKEFLSIENNNTAELKYDGEERRENDRDETMLAGARTPGIERFLLTFSFYTNLRQIFNTKGQTEGVSSLHGLRFLGMVWITLVHTIYYGNYIYANRVTATMTSNTMPAQVLANATLSVDTYFFMSGFLLSYVFLKAQKKSKWTPRLSTNLNQFCLSLTKRFVRLTPAYLFVILVAILNFSWHEKISLYLYAEPIHDLCSKYWWRNVLYVNNLFEWNDLCLSWSWYLSNDMQFFMFGTFLLILSSRHYGAALGTGALTLILSILLNAYKAYSLDFHLTSDEQIATLSELYVRPWLRIPPFLVGLATAQLLAKWDYKLHLSRKGLIFCWTLGVACNSFILFSVFNRPVPLCYSILYTALSRTLWAVGIGWVVVACCTNNAGMVNKFLSLRVWVPLSRLTFCAYLLNPFIVTSILLMSSYPLFAEFLTTGLIFLGVLVTTYVCAIPLSLLTEAPAIVLLRLIDAKRRAK